MISEIYHQAWAKSDIVTLKQNVCFDILFGKHRVSIYQTQNIKTQNHHFVLSLLYNTLTGRMVKSLAKRDLALPEKHNYLFPNMFYVYVLQSQLNKDIYIGYTTNLKNRFKQHYLGKVKSTKQYKPWILIYYESYRGKLDATKREKQLKIHAVKNELLSHLGESLS